MTALSNVGAPVGATLRWRRFRSAADCFGVVTRFPTLCYECVKCTYFGKIASPEGRRTYARPRGSQQCGSCDEQLTRPRSTPQARPSSRPRSRRAHPRGCLLPDPDARLRQHDRRRGGQHRRRRQGHRLPTLGTQGRPRGRRDGAALPRRDAATGHRLDPRGPARDVRLGAHLRELTDRHRLHADHDQGVDARRAHRHALPRGERACRAQRRPSSSARSTAARSAPTSR